MGIFSCWRVACEDAGQSAYSQLRLKVTGEYNRQQAGTSYLIVIKSQNMLQRCPVYTQRVSLVFVHAFAKVRNFECVASKMQREHATALSHLHDRC